MLKINNVQIPIKSMILLQKEKHNQKKLGYKNFATTANKNGDAVLLTYKNPERDELTSAYVVKKDGKESISFYRTSEKGYRKPYFKEIETWDIIKNNLIFNKTTKIFYNGFSKIPEAIRTTYTDQDIDDGVIIETKYPLEEYSKHFQRPNS